MAALWAMQPYVAGAHHDARMARAEAAAAQAQVRALNHEVATLKASACTTETRLYNLGVRLVQTQSGDRTDAYELLGAPPRC